MSDVTHSDRKLAQMICGAPLMEPRLVMEGVAQLIANHMDDERKLADAKTAKLMSALRDLIADHPGHKAPGKQGPLLRAMDAVAAIKDQP